MAGTSIPQKLSESEFQKLLVNIGEAEVASGATPSESSKKKIKKAQIAKELWDDVSSAVVSMAEHLSLFVFFIYDICKIFLV